MSKQDNQQDNQAVIRVMLVDDHRRIHQAIVEMLSFFDDIELVAQAHNGADALALCAEVKPDIILMDIVMPVMDGLEATKKILVAYPDIKILVLSSFKEHETVREILESGASGYILKESSVDDFAHTIRATSQGQSILSPEIMQAFLETPMPASSIQDLSPRENDVLKLFAAGMNNGEIAAELVISVSTVKFHIANILTKLGVETRAEALVVAAKNRLI